MTVKPNTPGLVSEASSRFGRPDDVGKQNRRKAPVAKRGASGSCEELFDVSYQIGVITPREVVRRRDLNISGLWRVIRQEPT